MRKKSNSNYSQQFGVTLIELLVALALGLAVLVGLSAVYVAAKQAFRFQGTSGQMQEDATFALDIISRQLRMAGFAGCRGVDSVMIGGVLTYFPQLGITPAPTAITGPNPLGTVYALDPLVTMQPLSPQNFLRGFDNVPSAMFASGSVPMSGTTDSIFFAGGSAKAASVTAAMVAASDPLTIGTDSAGWGTASVYNMIVSNCTSSSLFAGKLATVSGVSQVQHAVAFGNASDSFPSSPLYGVDALVMPLEWNFYYVATRAGASTPSLYRVSFDGASRQNAQELVSNVESMKLHYGENTLNDVVTGAPTMRADEWRTTAATVTDWSRVVAVRIGLMMVGAVNNTNADITATPKLLGDSYTVPTGASSARLRKEFSTTVVLRNRVAAR